MQAFTIASFTFRTKNGTVPEIGTYIIIGFSITDELSFCDKNEDLGVHAPKNDKRRVNKNKCLILSGFSNNFIISLFPSVSTAMPAIRPIVPDTNNGQFQDMDGVLWEKLPHYKRHTWKSADKHHHYIPN